jgi:hypothetical protein
VFVDPLLSNGCLCWLHSSCLEQICHNIYWQSEQSAESSKLTKANGFQCPELKNSGPLALNFEIRIEERGAKKEEQVWNENDSCFLLLVGLKYQSGLFWYKICINPFKAPLRFLLTYICWIINVFLTSFVLNNCARILYFYLCFAHMSSISSPYLRSPVSHKCLSAEETVLCPKVEFVRSVISHNYCAVFVLLVDSSSDVLTWCNKDDHGNNNNSIQFNSYLFTC